MTLKNIYLISILIGYAPLAVENIIYELRLLKDGYSYKNKAAFIKDILKPVIEGVLAFIPVINIIRGIKYESYGSSCWCFN